MARSTFPSQNVQSTPGPDDFWKLRCRKSARRSGAKHILKSKCTKHTILGPLLEVEMSKKCTPLWREAHFEVKMYKAPHVRATFGGSDLEKVHAVVARSTFRSQNVQNTRGSDHFWRFRCRFASLRVITLHSTTLQLQLQNYTTTLHYTPLHTATLKYVLPSASKNASSDALRDRIIWVRTSNFGEVCAKGSKSFFMCGTVARDLSCSPSNGFLHKCSIPWCCGGHRQK